MVTAIARNYYYSGKLPEGGRLKNVGTTALDLFDHGVTPGSSARLKMNVSSLAAVHAYPNLK